MSPSFRKVPCEEVASSSFFRYATLSFIARPMLTRNGRTNFSVATIEVFVSWSSLAGHARRGHFSYNGKISAVNFLSTLCFLICRISMSRAFLTVISPATGDERIGKFWCWSSASVSACLSSSLCENAGHAHLRPIGAGVVSH